MTPPSHHLAVTAHGEPTRTYGITDIEQLRPVLHHLHTKACELIERGRAVEITVSGRDKMTLFQRQHLNRLCGDLAKQVEWHGRWLTKDSWRHMLVAAYRTESEGEQEMVPGINGGFVVLGGSSRDLTRKETNDVIELAYAFGSPRNVNWTPAKKRAQPD